MEHKSLRQQAYEAIREWLSTSRLPRGFVTSELQLCRMLDMSRTPVRSALQQLETEGFVTIAPKHGVLILDSSAQRVGDLLDVVASLALFAFERQKSADAGALTPFADAHCTKLQSLVGNTDDPRDIDAGAVCEWEFELLRHLIRLNRNAEMDHLFRITSERLYWPLNARRWSSPFYPETKAVLESLLRDLRAAKETFPQRLFAYVQLLKKTWT
ncbi:GntR family transcriptional regulator [Paenibacillus hodogayensis]|uniref:GntR family transcriptional regulator n=1 Tax=Paenibacillus hodogayensis TaxID=279208 RepID=A0ABV5VZA1_9BACL